MAVSQHLAQGLAHGRREQINVEKSGNGEMDLKHYDISDRRSPKQTKDEE